MLAIGAHPDDVEVGAGGTLLSHVAQDHAVSTLVLTGGETVPADRAREASRAAELMGVRLFHVNLADSSVSEGGATIAEITRVIEELSPDTIYAPSAHDLNPDHRNVHHATMVAARRVPRVFCYQTPSSTVEFRPSRFVPVDEFMDRKLAVIRSYTSQVKQRRYLDAELLRRPAALEPLRPLALRRAVRGRARHRERRRAGDEAGLQRRRVARGLRSAGQQLAQHVCRMPPWR